MLSVSEELSSVETHFDISLSLLLYQFQKNLVVWKHPIPEHLSIYPLIVSEELSSVETLYCAPRLAPLPFLFQKNLVVWKQYLIFLCFKDKLTFQKNLVVWKQKIKIRISRMYTRVSEELSSVETDLHQ